MNSQGEDCAALPWTAIRGRLPLLPPGTRLGGRDSAPRTLAVDDSGLVNRVGAPYATPMHKSDTATAGVFPKTNWPEIMPGPERSASALDHVCRTYREPLLNFLRRSGDPQEAEEHLQGFFLTLLKRDFLQSVSQDKGRFRTFLIRSLQNYLRDLHRKHTAEKRDARKMAGSLDECHEDGQPIHDPAAPVDGPDVEFDKRWAQTVLANAQQRLREEWGREGKAALLEALLPLLWREPGSDAGAELGNRFGISAGNLRVILHRLRQQMRREIEEEVRQTVAVEADWKEEVRYLISLFG